MTTRDALDALSVAHDALIEGRDGAAAMTEAAPWARYDRLLCDTGFYRTRRIMHDYVRLSMGPDIDLNDNTVIGQLINAQASKMTKLWNLAESVQTSLFPDKATNTNLNTIVELTKL